MRSASSRRASCNRWDVVTNNRIPPRGFRWDSIYVAPPYEVAPKGDALEDQGRSR